MIAAMVWSSGKRLNALCEATHAWNAASDARGAAATKPAALTSRSCSRASASLRVEATPVAVASRVWIEEAASWSAMVCAAAVVATPPTSTMTTAMANHANRCTDVETASPVMTLGPGRGRVVPPHQ